MRVLGYGKFKNYCEKYGVELKGKMIKKMDNYSGVKWEDFDIELTNVQQYKDAFNLLDKLLEYDHNERILPRDALKHRFLADVSDEMDIDSSGEDYN